MKQSRTFISRRLFGTGIFIAAASAVFSFAIPSRADMLDEVQARGTLVWGADQEGGGPFVYPDPLDASRVIGFEVEIAELLAMELGVKAEFFQADWNTLPEFLNGRRIDVILNGYEWTPERAGRMEATRPYYLYELQLLAREDDRHIRSWEDLRRKPGAAKRSVSVLGGTAASAFLRETWADDVEIVEYDGNTNAMMQVRNGVHDATFEDLCVAVFYRDLPQGRGLRFVGAPVGEGSYVAFVKKGETRLVRALNAALDSGLQDGRLRRIYEKYGLWNATQEKLAGAETAGVSKKAISGLAVVRQYSEILLQSAGMTIILAVSSMPIAILVGLGIALLRLYGPSPIRGLCTVYVEVLRGTPLMLQLYVIFFLLPEIFPISLSPVVAAIAGLAINYSAYESEIYRAGLQAIPKGQMEAALSLGMTRTAALRHVIVPQAVRIVIPPVTNDFIALFKDTSICSVIAITELTKRYNMLANSTGAILELAAMTAALYLAMSYPLSLLARRLESRLSADQQIAAVA